MCLHKYLNICYPPRPTLLWELQNLQSQHCKRIPCIRKSGAGFASRVDVLWIVEYMESKKLRDPGIFKPKKFGCLRRN